MEDICPFWTMLIKPGETSQVKYPDGCFLTITNACITELPSDIDPKKPVRLFANVKYVDSEVDDKNVLIASLVPHTSEHSQLNYVFSPINEVNLSITGNAPIQVSGIIQPIFSNDEEEEEEESKENQEE